MREPILSVKLSAGYGKQTILREVAFELHAGDRLGLVGASGAGKSTLLMALLGLLPWRGGWAQGEVTLQGKNLLRLPEREARRLRGSAVALVPQSPLTALNSALSLRTHFAEAWRAHGKSHRELDARLAALLGRVNLPSGGDFLKRRPPQISVGQAQRVTIALALLHGPKILIADEPTSSLDPVTQREVLELLREISEEQGTAMLFISHDLLSVLQLTQQVALLYGGEIAERVAVQRIDQDARHPALRELLRTLPVPAAVVLEHAANRSPRARGAAPPFASPSSRQDYSSNPMVCEVT